MGVLRLVLAIAVLIGHSNAGLFGLTMTVSGKLPVEAFYVISGFIIAFVFTEKYAALPHGNSLFWVNRFFRLWPAFVAVGAATAIAYWISARLGQPVDARLHYVVGEVSKLNPVVCAIAALPNLLLFGADWTQLFYIAPHGGLVFTPTDGVGLFAGNLLLIPQGWSLGIEASFYVIAPWLLRRSSRVVVAVAMGSIAFRLWTYYGIGWMNNMWTYRVFPQELALFLVGVLSYRAYRRLQPEINANVLNALGIVAAVVLIGGMVLYDKATGNWRYWSYLAALPVLLPFLFHLTRRSAVDRYIGELSYPIYIVHVGLLPYLFATGWPNTNGLLATGGCVLAAIVIYLCIQRPIDRWRHHLTTRTHA